MAAVIIRAGWRPRPTKGRVTITKRRYSGAVVQVDVAPSYLVPTPYPAYTSTVHAGASVTLEAVTGYAAATLQPFNGAAVTLETVTGLAYGGATAQVTLQPVTGIASGTIDAVGRASVTLEAVTGFASSLTGALGSADVTLQPVTGAAFGGGSGAGTLLPVTGTAAGTSGGVGRASVTLMEVVGSGNVTSESYGGADVTMMAVISSPRGSAWVTLPAVTGHAVGHEIVAVTYEAYAINLTTGAVTHYTNYPFDNILRFGSSYYGISASGIYLIGGDLDLTIPIDAHIKTFATKLGSQNQKRVPYVYSSGRSDGGVMVGVTADEGETYEYESDWGEVAGSTNHRTVVGKGVKGVYYSFDVKNVNGGSLELDEISVHVAPTQRAI